MPRRGRGEGGKPRLRPDGRWECQYRDRTGKLKSVYGKTEQEAKRELRFVLERRDRGLAGGSVTVGAWLDRWRASLPDRGYRETTIADYAYKVRLVPEWVRALNIEDLDPLDVEQMLSALRKTHAASTVAQVRSVLRSALGQAQRYGRVTRNVAALVDPPKVEHAEIEPLSVSEARALLDAVSGHRLASLYSVALSVGLRESEAIGLKWSKVDLDDGVVTIDSQIARTNTGMRVEGQPKTRRSVRDVALPTVCVGALRAHRKRLLEERLRAGDLWKDHGLVWPSERGTPLGHRNLLRHLYRTCERAGIRRVSFHTLRHSAATLLLAQGVPERVTMDLLGHSDRRMVVLYQHVGEELRRDAAEAMDRLWRSD